MTYTVFGGTLNLAQLNSTIVVLQYLCMFMTLCLSELSVLFITAIGAQIVDAEVPISLL